MDAWTMTKRLNVASLDDSASYPDAQGALWRPRLTHYDPFGVSYRDANWALLWLRLGQVHHLFTLSEANVGGFTLAHRFNEPDIQPLCIWMKHSSTRFIRSSV